MTEAEELVRAYARLCGARDMPPLPQAEANGSGLIFAPHPDDECIIGTLPLRLQQEAGMKISVVPVTLGSKAERRAERKAELAAACAKLGFAVLDPAAQSFTEVRAETKSAQPIYWDGIVGKTAALLEKTQPQIIFVPHRQDGHPTHCGTHHLVLDALAKLPESFSTQVVFTEFWHPQQDPNLLVECAPRDLIRLVEALTGYANEIARNPYHRTLPAWMIDNARRGAETVAGFGETAHAIGFATLYQMGLWRSGHYHEIEADVILPADYSAASLMTAR